MKFLLLLVPLFASAAQSVVVLDDFEASSPPGRWLGPIAVDRTKASHGRSSARLNFSSGKAEFSSTSLRKDWSGFDRLLFDVHYPGYDIRTLTVRVYDETGGAASKAAKYDYFEARRKVLLQHGWNHVEIRLTPLQAASYLRNISMDRIVRLSFLADSSPSVLNIDNIRLVKGEEGLETASASAPGDMVSTIENRWVAVRQVARPEDVPESAEVGELRAAAERERTQLERTIQGARVQGIDTIYSERRLVVADLGLQVRPVLPWFNNDRSKAEMFRYVVETCRVERHALEDRLTGAHRLPETDDTQLPEPLAPPLPHLRGLPAKGWFFRDAVGKPLNIISIHSPSRVLERFFATPLQHIESYTVGGASRWNLEESPVYQAFLDNPDAKRVGWDGWCGHLIRDLDSMGGSKKDNVVICLENGAIRKAISEYIRINIPKLKENPELLYNIMAYELMYICYCDESRRMFHRWLEAKHGIVAQMNAAWGTSYKSFEEVTPPPVQNSRPLPGTNRALWYDWARFNQDRFTDHLLWVKSEIRKYDSTTPLAAGGSSSMLAGRTGTTGIDEERIVNEVDDVIIHEGGGSTLGMDLQRALANTPKPLADPEMNVTRVRDLFPHLLHGKSVIQIYHWPSQPAAEFHSNTQHSWAHSWEKPLREVDELLRVALDARRLRNEIASFADVPAEVAILYSQTSTLQLPPEMLTWRTTPYLAELERAYESGKYLDTPITFVTERQIRDGRAARYKLLIVPEARNLPADIVAKIWDFARSGGRVLVMPESLVGDEYDRPQSYLSEIGVTVHSTERPSVTGRGQQRQGYDQTFEEMISFRSAGGQTMRSVSGAKLGDITELRTKGIRQKIDITGSTHRVLDFSDGSPGLVRTPLGRGEIYYSASSIEGEDYTRLLNVLVKGSGIDRQLQVFMGKVEARFSTIGDRRLIYAVNFRNEAIDVPLRLAGGAIQELHDLRQDCAIRGNVVHLFAGETGLYEVTR
jgi:beta-galactosidase GanA